MPLPGAWGNNAQTCGLPHCGSRLLVDNDILDLTGRVALVTGGNGGIGFGMADAMAEAGADVCIWGTRKEKTDAAAEKLKRHGR